MSRPATRPIEPVALIVVGVLLAACGQAPAPRAGSTPTTATAQQVIPGPDLLEAHLFGPTSGWLQTADRVLTTEDSGRTWADVTPPGGRNALLETAFFLDPYQAWAIVRLTQGDLALFISSDGGRHWSSRATPASQPMDLVGPVYLTFINPKRGWMVVDQGSHSGFMHFTGFQTFDGGRTWTGLTFPQSARVVFANELDGFSVSDWGPPFGAYVTHDGGRTWRRLTVPPIDASRASPVFEPPVFSDDRNGVLAGGMMDPSGGIASEVFYTTSDGGRSWSFVTNVPNPNTQSSAQLAGVASPTAWLAAFLGPGPAAGGTYTQLKATQDGGKTWEWTPTVLAGAFVDQVSFAGSTGWGIINQSGCRGFKTDCYTNSGLFQTVDGGAHWQQVSVP
ncbi:MAG TPA: hypothetical protein VND96_01480 [Candidatus Micrarchaeaceae archaeon]|nr:hypothetical protein [Candidatus Micrarchaeaceae archaeon]